MLPKNADLYFSPTQTKHYEAHISILLATSLSNLFSTVCNFENMYYFHRHVDIYSIVLSATSQLLSQWSFRHLSTCFIASKCRTRTLLALVQRLQRKNSASPCNERGCRLVLPDARCCDYLRYSQTSHVTTAPEPAHGSVQLTSYAIRLLT